MAEGKDKGTNRSGLAPDFIDKRVEQLLRDPRVIEAIEASASGAHAEIGLMAQSAKFFFEGGKPIIPLFEPAFVCKGSWNSEHLLTASSTEAEIQSAGGEAQYVAACIVNFASVPDARAYFRTFLEQAGDIAIAPQFSPDLWRSVPYVGADPATLQANKLKLTGDGIAICVVDMGCDFAHRNFRQTDHPELTRIKLLAVMDEKGHAYEYTDTNADSRRNLNKQISNAKPYANYDPNDPKYHVIAPGQDGAHGTLVLDIAGGNGSGTGMAGVAPEADLYFIQVYVSTSKSRRFVDGTQILHALTYAQKRIPGPTVFNVSLGTNQGPHDTINHDPSNPNLSWNLAINKLFEFSPGNWKRGQCLVVSAGNNYNSSLHASGTAAANAPATFDVAVRAGDMTQNELAIWFDRKGLDVSVRAMLVDYKDAPKNYQPAWQQPGSLVDSSQRKSGRLYDIEGYGADGLHKISVSLTPPLGRKSIQLADYDKWEIWRIEVNAAKASPADPLTLDAWMDRDDLDQAAFTTPAMPTGHNANADVDPIGSLNGLAAGVKSAIVVGAIGAATYTKGEPVDGPGLGRAVAFSSAGPTRDKLRRPDISAPGEGISGAKSGTDPVALKTGYEKAPTTIMSGTSMAAPHITGLVALFFQKYNAAPPDGEGVRQALVASARPESAGGATRWDPQRGYGCVDAIRFLLS